MKTLSLKLDNAIFDETEKITSEIKTTRNRYINEAVELYNQFNKRKLLKMQIQKESLLTKNESLEILKEFESFVDED
jgi:predicted transcriptional regulator